MAGKAFGERAEAERKTVGFAPASAARLAAGKPFRQFYPRSRRRAHQQQQAAQAMFKRADMAGKIAQGAGPHPAGRKMLHTPERACQHKEEAAQQFPRAAGWLGAAGLCEGNAAFDHGAKSAGIAWPAG